MTTPDELIERLRQSEIRSLATEAAVAHLLASESSVNVPESTVAVAAILPIYQRRLRRVPPDVIGLEDLIARLISAGVPDVLLAVHVSRGQATTVIRTPDGALIGCVVGPDRRADDETDKGD